MLCLPGLTPVVKVDQATGEIGGSVLHSGEKVPCAASFSKLGNWCPCFLNWLNRLKSMPSKPISRTRLNLAFFMMRAFLMKRSRARMGKVMKLKMARKKAAKMKKNEPTKAKPAPGPT